MYAALPVLAEWFIENNKTLCYYNIEDIGGWGPYLIWTSIYMTFVDFDDFEKWPGVGLTQCLVLTGLCIRVGSIQPFSLFSMISIAI